MDDYKDIKDMLRPRREFAASAKLRRQINHTLDSQVNRRKPMRWILGLGASCAAAAVLLLIFLPAKMSATEILADAMRQLMKADRIEMKIDVRTQPVENFKYVSLDDDFVRHDVQILKSDSLLSWCIDKGGRTLMSRNGAVYSWINDLKIGWKSTDSDPEKFLGELAMLLTPEKIIEAELANCKLRSSDRYTLSRSGGEIILTVHARPKGDFSNPYMLNASIAESENVRTYIIDAASKRLKSASVSIIDGKRRIEVLRIAGIDYNPHVADLAALPPDIRFIDLSVTLLPGMQGLSPTEAASAFLCALERWDTSILERAIEKDALTMIYERDFKGAVLVSIGGAFTSGNDGTTFVPYALRLPDGSIKRHNLAMQKNPQGGWTVVGGL